MKSTAFISFSQFASENGGFAKVSPCKVEGLPYGILYQRHLSDGTVKNVKGMTFVNKQGSEVSVALDEDLWGKSLQDVVSMRATAGIAKSYYIDRDGNERESVTYYGSKSRFDEANSISLD